MLRCLLLLLVLVVVVPATAQTSDSQKPDPAKAQAAFAAAKRAYEKGDFETSVTKLREAYTWYPDPAIRVSIARRLLDLDRPTEALTELEAVKKPRGKLRRLIKAEKAKIAALLTHPVPVVLTTTPPGATIKLGARAPVRAPIRLSLPRGKVQVIVTLDGHRALSEVLAVRGTKTLKRTYRLARLVSRLTVLVIGAAPDREEGAVVVQVDGRPVEVGRSFEVTPGRRAVRCGYGDGAPPTTLAVQVPAGRSVTIRCALPAPTHIAGAWKKPVGWSSVGGGIAALGAGIGILVSHLMEADTYPEPRYTVTSSSKPLAGGMITGLGAALLGVGTWLVVSE